MTTSIEWFERPELDAPVLVVMLNGWIDTSGAAAAAMASIESGCATRTIARFDRDTFIDYRSRRPVMEIREGVNARLIWADIELKVGQDRAGRPVLLLTGHEPDANWERFCREMLAAAESLGVTKMIGLGAYPFATPHTRPARLSTTSPDASLTELLPYQRTSVDVPAGITAVLEHVFHGAGIPALTLWAQVPHYVSAMSYPSASVALVDAVHELGGPAADSSSLRSEAIVQRQRLDDLVSANDDHAAMVRQLERAYDAYVAEQAGTEGDRPAFGDRAPMSDEPIPSADELAAELEQFLREQGPG